MGWQMGRHMQSKRLKGAMDGVGGKRLKGAMGWQMGRHRQSKRLKGAMDGVGGKRLKGAMEGVAGKRLKGAIRWARRGGGQKVERGDPLVKKGWQAKG